MSVKTATTIPQVSMDDLRSGRSTDILRQCVTTSGLFYLTECGMLEEAHRPARDLVMDFFEHATPAERQALSARNVRIRRGYSELGAESTATVTNTGSYSDYSMSYSMGLVDNLFPSVQFEKTWSDYFNCLYTLSREIARHVLLSTGSYDGRDMDTLLDCDPLLRLRYFPEVPSHRVAEREPLRMATHYDLSIVTLIHQTTCSNGFVSLRADFEGESVQLPVLENAMLVLCGAVATIATQGFAVAPRHHVAAPPSSLRSGSDRTSSVFFLRPKGDFAFSVSNARAYGLDVELPNEAATFGDWIGSNYVAMHTDPEPQVS